MNRKKLSIKKNPGRDETLSSLPGLGAPIKTPNIRAEEFMSRLMSSGFISQNKAYLDNYVNADLSIALAHIKSAYKTYVCQNSWSEEKFTQVIFEIIEKRWFLTPKSFLKLGIKYDEGSIYKKDKNNTSENQYSDDELLSELMKNPYFNQ